MFCCVFRTSSSVHHNPLMNSPSRARCTKHVTHRLNAANIYHTNNGEYSYKNQETHWQGMMYIRCRAQRSNKLLFSSAKRMCLLLSPKLPPSSFQHSPLVDDTSSTASSPYDFFNLQEDCFVWVSRISEKHPIPTSRHQCGTGTAPPMSKGVCAIITNKCAA